MGAVSVIFWGVIVLAVLVVVHELGHFIAARAFGVRVTEFMIGLPGPSIGFTRNGTRYGITCIPLGGYNRITGMESGPEDPNLEQVLAYVYRQGVADVEHTALACGLSPEEAETALFILDGWGSINAPGRENPHEQYAAPKTGVYELGQPREVEDSKALLDAERQQTYRGLSFPKRLVVLFAGPLMNILLAFVILLVVFCGVGIPVVSTQLSSVVEDGPAAAAGLQAGDRIVAIDDTPIDDWESLSLALLEVEPGATVAVGYERDGVEHTAQVTTVVSKDDTAQLGVYAGTEQFRLSVPLGLQASWDYLAITVWSYASLFNPATAADTLSQSTSVVGIAVMSQQAASAGIVPLLYFIAVISLSLGIVNLLPVPPLDGGRIVVEVIQRIAHREVPTKVINGITIVVIALLLVLFLFMTQQDIARFVLGGS